MLFLYRKFSTVLSFECAYTLDAYNEAVNVAKLRPGLLSYVP